MRGKQEEVLRGLNITRENGLVMPFPSHGSLPKMQSVGGYRTIADQTERAYEEHNKNMSHRMRKIKEKAHSTIEFLRSPAQQPDYRLDSQNLRARLARKLLQFSKNPMRSQKKSQNDSKFPFRTHVKQRRTNLVILTNKQYLNKIKSSQHPSLDNSIPSPRQPAPHFTRSRSFFSSSPQGSRSNLNSLAHTTFQDMRPGQTTKQSPYGRPMQLGVRRLAIINKEEDKCMDRRRQYRQNISIKYFVNPPQPVPVPRMQPSREPSNAEFKGWQDHAYDESEFFQQ